MFRDRVLQHYRERGYTLRERVKVRGHSGAVHACDLVAQGPLGNLVVQFEDYGGFEGPELESVRRIARDVGAVPVIAAKHVGDTIRRHADRNGVVILDEPALGVPMAREVLAPVHGTEAYPPWPTLDRPHRARTDKGEEAASGAHAASPAASTAWPADGRMHPAPGPRMDPGEVDDLVTEWSAHEEPRSTRREDPGFWRYDRPANAPHKETPKTAAKDAPAPGKRSGFGWLQETKEGADENAEARPRRSTEAQIRPEPILLHNVDAFVAPVRNTRDVGAELPRGEISSRRGWGRTVLGYAVAGAVAGAAFLGIGMFFGAF